MDRIPNRLIIFYLSIVGRVLHMHKHGDGWIVLLPDMQYVSGNKARLLRKKWKPIRIC